ncbi:MAG: hypothetical protein ACPLZY_02750 [Candidatus Norongarragalinales archaeon]
MGKRKDLIYWNIPVTKTLDEAVERAVKIDTHVSKSDFVRDAVRRLLLQLGIQLQRLGETNNHGADNFNKIADIVRRHSDSYISAGKNGH